MDTQFNRLVDRFEDETKSGKSPQIESYISEWLAESKRTVLLELISLEVFYRSRRGQLTCASDYTRFGEVAVGHAEQAIQDYAMYQPKSSPVEEF